MGSQYDKLISARAAVDVALTCVDQQRERVAELRRQGFGTAKAEEQLRVLLQCLEAMRDYMNIVEHEVPQRPAEHLSEAA